MQRGNVLEHGDLIATEDGFIARVLAATEQLSSIYTDDSLLLARACYHLGNRHVELQITQKSVHYRHDHVLDEMLKSFGLNVISESLPFQPEKGAYNSQSTSHGHHQEH
jgi:urease accessory protein